jgi:hypothetical protein
MLALVTLLGRNEAIMDWLLVFLLRRVPVGYGELLEMMDLVAAHQMKELI